MKDILILIGSSRGLKDAKTMDMVLGINVNFKIVFSYFQYYIYCRYTLELPHRGNSKVFLQPMSFQ